MDFKGRLKVAGDSGPGIPVDLRLDDIYLELWSEGEELGVWRFDVVEVARSSGNKFSLDLDGEAMSFEAIDPLGFAYDGLTFIEAVSSKLRKKRRGFRFRDADSQPLRGARIPGRSEPQPTDPATEERVRSLPGVAALEQVEALPQVKPERPAASAGGGLGAFFGTPEPAAGDHVSPPSVPGQPENTQPMEVQPVEPQPVEVQPVEEPIQERPVAAAPVSPVHDVPSPVNPEPMVVVVEELTSVSYAHDAVVEVSAQVTEPVAVVEPEPVNEVEPVAVVEPQPLPEPDLEADEIVEPTPSPNGRVPVTHAVDAVFADPLTEEVSDPVADGDEAETDDETTSGDAPAPRGRHTSSRRGRRSKRKRTDDHDHEYDIARTVGGLTRRVCMHCGHVSFDSEDVYQGWG